MSNLRLHCLMIFYDFYYFFFLTYSYRHIEIIKFIEFRFATLKDKVHIYAAILLEVTCGICATVNYMLLVLYFDAITEYVKTKEKDRLVKSAGMTTLKLCSNCGLQILMTYVSTVLLTRSASRQAHQIRVKYLRAALSQDLSYYDVNPSTDLASKMLEDVPKIEDGIGEKLGSFVFGVAHCVACIAAAFIMDIWFTAFCLAVLPCALFFYGVAAFVASRYAKQEAVVLGRAGAVAEEVLSAIRTVYAFNGQRAECERYKTLLEEARSINTRKAFSNGVADGTAYFFMFSSYGQWFRYAFYLKETYPGHYDLRKILGVFFWMGSAFFTLVAISLMMEVFGTACGAGAQIFEFIDNKPLINPLIERGLTPETIKGDIEFRDVNFNYPSRPHIEVIKGLTFEVKNGQSVAIIGQSGSGKTSILNLISRFYDVIEGKVLLDGQDVRDLSVRWLRAQVGLVSQEPVLFNMTVRENIRFGRQDATDAEIEAVAREANAHDFIVRLPEGYDTMVGDRGASLSGGQKQRIAIARALVRDPRVLLLDEATSALDTASEAKVQRAIVKAQNRRTIIIVAHRLSTIKNADVIHVLVRGRIVESGTHRELLDMKGHYYDMVLLQGLTEEYDLDHGERSRTTSIEKRGVFGEQIKSYEVDEAIEELPVGSFLSIVRYNKPEWISLSVACICTLCVSAGVPTSSIPMTEFAYWLTHLADKDPDSLNAELVRLATTSLGVACIITVLLFLQTYLFSRAGESLTKRLRVSMFEKLLQQEVAFFDRPENSTGVLCAKLSGEASAVQGATGQRFGLLIQTIGSIIFAIIIAMNYEWHLGLFYVCCLPIFVYLMYKEASLVSEQSSSIVEIMEDSSKLAVEAVANIPTVASLGRQETVIRLYENSLIGVVANASRASHVRGLVYGVMTSYMILVIGLALYYATTLIVNDSVTTIAVFTASDTMIYGTLTTVFTFAYVPNFQKAYLAAKRINILLNRTPKIRNSDQLCTDFSPTGQVSFHDVYFNYPTAPMNRVLDCLNLKIPKGKTVALVGFSGCGKSTIFRLLQRFYDPDIGFIAMDDVPVKNVLMKDLRQCMGFVQQEPVLFDRTIAQNIIYGDNTRVPSMDEIIKVAKQANIHDFISTLPQGYDTNIGAKGTQLSGGQKQRIAIARALIRMPKLLLFDEATSALDTKSEKEVQEALDKTKEGRTCVTIAHRLSTIRDADIIYFVHDGYIVEQGTHSELMDKKGMYYFFNHQG